MYKNRITYGLVTPVFVFLLGGCSHHTLRFKGAHFAVPFTSEKPLSGQFSITSSSPTKIKIIDDIGSNPPERSMPEIGGGGDFADITGITYLGFDFNLGLFKSLDFYLDNSLYGLRWQYLNHGAGSGHWVSAIQAGLSSSAYSSYRQSDTNAATAESEVKRSQVGASIGYNFSSITPYVSFLLESFNVDTKVTNVHGSFGPYNDKGKHHYTALGLTTNSRGFTYAFEYNWISSKWQGTESKSRGALGLKLGYTW